MAIPEEISGNIVTRKFEFRISIETFDSNIVKNFFQEERGEGESENLTLYFWTSEF